MTVSQYGSTVYIGIGIVYPIDIRIFIICRFIQRLNNMIVHVATVNSHHLVLVVDIRSSL